MSERDQPSSPNWTQLLEEVIAAAGQEIRSAMPGVITGVAADRSTASVQPAVRRAGADGDDPVIPDVPVLWPRSSKGRITWPLEAGDGCLLIFADRSLEEWESADGEKAVEATDPRTHDITDALCIPLGLGRGSTSPTDIDLEVESGAVNVGGDAVACVDYLLKGTSFNTAHGTLLGALSSAFGAEATAYGQLAADPSHSSYATELAAAATACTAAATAIATYLALATGLLAAKGKVC